MRGSSVLASGRVLTAAFMLAVFVAMSLLALGFPPGARLMPLMAGVPGSALAALCVIQELRKAARGAADGGAAGRLAVERAMLLWTLAFFAGILAFGFLYAVPVLVFTYLRFGARETVVTAVAGTVGTWAVLYGLFERVFAIPLFAGLLGAWLGL